MADRVLLIVENLDTLVSIRPHLPRGWVAVSPFAALPGHGYEVVVVPKAIAEGNLRSAMSSAQVMEWYVKFILPSMAPNCRVLKT
jgi:hypothetical protein